MTAGRLLLNCFMSNEESSLAPSKKINQIYLNNYIINFPSTIAGLGN